VLPLDGPAAWARVALAALVGAGAAAVAPRILRILRG